MFFISLTPELELEYALELGLGIPNRNSYKPAQNQLVWLEVNAHVQCAKGQGAVVWYGQARTGARFRYILLALACSLRARRARIIFLPFYIPYNQKAQRSK
jgi:hypothetical protein